MLIYRHKLLFFVEFCPVFSTLITFFNNLLKVDIDFLGLMLYFYIASNTIQK